MIARRAGLGRHARRARTLARAAAHAVVTSAVTASAVTALAVTALAVTALAVTALAVAAPLGAQAAPAAPAAQAAPAAPDAPPAPAGRPTLEPLRVGGEVLVGTYAGLGGFLIGRFIGGSIGDLMPASERDKENLAHVTGLVVGGLATAGGTFAVGAVRSNQTASYPATLLGAGAGYVTGLAVTRLLFPRSRPSVTPEQSRARWLQATVQSLLPAIGATIAFNSSRRFK